MFASPGASAGKANSARTCSDTSCLITKSLGGGIIVKSDATLVVVNHNVAENREAFVDLIHTHALWSNNYRLWDETCLEKKKTKKEK